MRLSWWLTRNTARPRIVLAMLGFVLLAVYGLGAALTDDAASEGRLRVPFLRKNRATTTATRTNAPRSNQSVHRLSRAPIMSLLR
jgi:hypothetical protein